jgi:hypothetical protein
MSKKSKLSDADIKVLLDKVSFPCPSMTPPPHINQRCTMTPMEINMENVKEDTNMNKTYGYSIGGEPAVDLPPVHLKPRCIATPMENKMSEIKAVTEEYEGNVYQIYKPYLFSLSGATWFYDKLINIDAIFNLKPFGTKSGEWSYIKEVPSYEPMGTITPAPVPLIHGKAYTFDCDNHSDVIGLFSKGGGLFLIHDGAVFNACFCTNIRPMAVVETLKGNGE